jgi:hypothetical protein
MAYKPTTIRHKSYLYCENNSYFTEDTILCYTFKDDNVRSVPYCKKNWHIVDCKEKIDCYLKFKITNIILSYNIDTQQFTAYKVFIYLCFKLKNYLKVFFN